MRQKLFESLLGRQLDYSYEVDQESLLYQPNGIRAHAERLVTEYAEIRKEHEEVGFLISLECAVLINSCRLKSTVPSFGFAMILEEQS